MFTIHDVLRLFPLTAAIIVVGMSIWLTWRYPQPFFRSWTLAHASGLATLLLELASRFTGRHPIPTLLATATETLVAVFLWQSARLLMLKPRLPRWGAAAAAAVAASSVALWLAGQGFEILVLPPILCATVAFVGLGVVFLRAPSPGHWLPSGFLAGALIVNGLWVFAYPLLVGTGWDWVSYWVNGSLLLFIGIGMATYLLERNAHELRLLIEGGRDRALVLLDPSGRIANWNRGAERLFGFRVEEVIGREPTALGGLSLDPAGITEETGWRRRKDGTRFWAQTTVSPIREADGGLDGYAVLVRDISDRRASDLERARLLAAANQSRDAILLTDLDGAIRYANPAFSGRPGGTGAESVGTSLFAIFGDPHGPEVRQLQRAMALGESWSVRRNSRGGPGASCVEVIRLVPVRDGGVVTDFLVVLSDVTRETALQDQLSQSQKLESIGRFSSGIAHDFGNVLTVIGAYNHLLKTSAPSERISERCSTAIDKAMGRASRLLRQLLAFSRKGASEPQRVDLGALVPPVVEMLASLLGNSYRMRTEFAPGLGPVWADAGRLEQILVNLTLNARDAMPEGGVVTVRTSWESPSRPDGEPPAGRWACLAVSDTGVGMDEQTRSRIFESFFTTKPRERGTGLGLSIVDEIVREAGGSIAVESAPGQGSTFRVFLPVIEASGPDLVSDRPPAPRGAALLIACAEPGLAAAVRSSVDEGDRRVLQARSAAEARSLAGDHPGDLALLILDGALWAAGGRALAEDLRRDRPGTRILLLGHPEAPDAASTGVDGAQVLVTPIAPEELCERVREILGR